MDEAKIYVHVKFGVKKNLCKEKEKKKRNQPMNSAGYTVFLVPANPLLFMADFIFLFLLSQISVETQILYEGRYFLILSIHFFLQFFMCIYW
jgi:hypothetical protein